MVFAPQYNQMVLTQPDLALQSAVDFMINYRIELLNAPVVIGASGAVFGILLAFGMLFPNSLIYIYFAIPIKAKYFVILYAAIELYSGMSKSGSNVAHFAHLGGMVFGFFLILYWKKRMRFY
jgi:membrane associated rhomboid family serine protease